MAGYQPLKIAGFETGLVQEREDFLLPNDAYPTLENVFVWRERLKRKKGVELLGRLRRVLTGQALGATDGAGAFTGNITAILGLETETEIEPGSVEITIGAETFTEASPPDGTLTGNLGGTGTINYVTTVLTITGAPVATPITADFNYFPGLPVMGLRSRELTGINSEQTIAFDTKYAYRFVTGWEEFIPGTTWQGTDSDFFWSTNYWVDDGNRKIFWVTNFNQSTGTGDPIRYTNGTAWGDFAPQINSTPEYLTQCLAILPFRGRLVTFNTWEGVDLATSVNYRQRIRWAAIGTPFTVVGTIAVPTNANAWRDDIRGQGGFLDIPTAENIVAVGFVRDNLVVYCERSTWQLRYTGRSIAPFQIEKVNSELGAESTFSAVQFDTSLVGIGDKGVVECDSFKSDRIDIKIPDLVFYFNNDTNGEKRVHGIRDFAQRLAYWTYAFKDANSAVRYPNRRLVYNYENDSWAIFRDSFTCLGTYQKQRSARWSDFSEDLDKNRWLAQNYTWFNRPALFPLIVAGNQQGFVEILDSQATNDVSLTITNITGNTTTPTLVESKDHNLEDGDVIKINEIPAGTDFDDLNGQVFSIERVTDDTFLLWVYDSDTGEFSEPQTNVPGTYVGGGKIAVRDNFRIVSKKFNAMNEGQNIQLGYIDVLLDTTENGAITLNVYLNYNDTLPVNQYPENNPNPATSLPDTFFNSTVPTTQIAGLQSNKNWQRVFCATRGAFITIEWTLSNEQMTGDAQESNVQIDAQILWMRKAGRQLPVGV